MNRSLRSDSKKSEARKYKKQTFDDYGLFLCAAGGNRTRMKSPPHDFESCASASSATAASLNSQARTLSFDYEF